MIYEEPRYLPAGDCFMLIELGNEISLDVNFLAHTFGRTVAAQNIAGIIQTYPGTASLLIHYEPEEIAYENLERAMRHLSQSIDRLGSMELDSRLIYLPAFYLDPWTKASVEDYSRTIKPKKWDPELIVELNGLDDLDQFVRVHSASEYWVLTVGSFPGAPLFIPLDPRSILGAPKYNPPRISTPVGAIGLAGGSTCMYPIDSSGGYQIFARTPVPIWDTRGRISGMDETFCLFRPGDRVKFVPCGMEEFTAIERRVAEGCYVLDLIDYQKFSFAKYKGWVASIDRTRRF